MKYILNTVKITALLAVIGFTFFASLYLVSCDNGSTGTAPTITTTSLPNGTVGTAYHQTLAAAGDAPITWSVETGSLPNGLTLYSTGIISGTPAAADACHFTVKATNAAGSGTKPLSIAITGGGDSEERWSSYQHPDSTASLDHFSIDSDSVVKVTVGGTPELDAESWKVQVSYLYTAKTNTPYTYTFMAKTESGTRKLSVLYYGDSASDTWFIRNFDLTSSWQTFTIEGQAIPKAGIHAVDFRGANEIGTFYVKMISIAETVSGNGPGTDPAIPPAFGNIWDFKDWLENQPANTASTPYTVKLNDGVYYLAETLNNNPDKYVYLDLSGSTITSFPYNAFYDSSTHRWAECATLVGITIPDSVTSIEDRAFSVFTNLSAINADSGNSNYSSENGVLYNKTKTTLILYPQAKTGAFTIPNSVTSIGNSAFWDCTGLTSVTFTPTSKVTSMNGAFSGCTSLTSVTIPNSVTDISYAFVGCTSLTSVTFTPTSKITDMSNAFSGCSSLASVTIPNSVTDISYAFSYCTSLASITIPNSVTSMNGAFSGCTSLASITFTPTSKVTYIREQAFSGCSSLTSVTIPNSVTSIGDSAFYGCTSLTSVTIPNSVTSIGSSAFSYCTSLASVTIGSGVTSIGNGAFSNAQNLKNITIKSNRACTSTNNWGNVFPASGLSVMFEDVTSIDQYAFYNCTRLASVTIGSSVESIGQYAFYDCTSLASVTFQRNASTTINTNTFPGNLTGQSGGTGNYNRYGTWVTTNPGTSSTWTKK